MSHLTCYITYYDPIISPYTNQVLEIYLMILILINYLAHAGKHYRLLIINKILVINNSYDYQALDCAALRYIIQQRYFTRTGTELNRVNIIRT